jgi:hypothetical protein
MNGPTHGVLIAMELPRSRTEQEVTRTNPSISVRLIRLRRTDEEIRIVEGG